ncbi:uncharacterized mitochondrial protein-like protein [Tanacetum coccineum]
MHSALPTTGTNMPLRPGLILARTMLPIIEDWDTDSDNDSEVPKESSKDAVADDAGKKTNKEPANEGERNGQEKEGGALNKEDDQNVQDFRAALDNLLIFHRSFSFLRFEDTVSYSGAYDDGMMGRVTPKKKALINEELLPPVARIKDNQVYKVERPDMVLYSAPRALFQVTPKVSHLDAVRYLKGQPKLGLWYPRDSPFDLEAFYDSDDPNMPNLEEIVYSDDDEEVGAEADMNNLAITVPVSPIPTTRLHKDYPFEQIIRDIHLAPQTRKMTKSVTEHEEVYVCQPPGFEDPKFPNKVYKVEKALYGLHQAPRAWYETLSTYLLENGFRRGTIDKTLFIKKDKGDILLVQTASTPIETNKALLKDEEAAYVDVHLYRSMVGSLMYLTASRPDITFVVCAYARFQVTPKTSHLHAVKRIFRYLKGYPKLGLWYLRDSPFDLETFSDSDYTGASLDRKSTIGGCQFLGRRLISWQCKKQTIVSNSTTKSEYVAVRTLLWSDETVIKEWEDRMERAATTASSLEAEQDNVNTLGSGEDSMKLKELMELCIKLPERALDLA